MEIVGDMSLQSRHLRVTAPSLWVQRFSPLIPKGGTVLDLACGGGRHIRYLLNMGYKVVALDRDVTHVADLADKPEIEVIEADLENGGAWPVEGRTFDAVIIVNYLYRPLFQRLFEAVGENGLFIYETFARGNEKITRPRNPDHLLCSGELLEMIHRRLQVIAYEHGLIEAGPTTGIMQRICAVNDLKVSNREDGEPEPHNIRP